MLVRFLFLSIGLTASCLAAPEAGELAAALSRRTTDPAATYRVRDLQITRGDIKIYLTEGVLSFLRPIDGRVIGAVFTTRNVEGGDAEVLVLPPARSERASLASFTQQPNLDEHIGAAIFLFSDDTAADLMRQINNGSPRPASELLDQLNEQFGPAMGNVTGALDLRLLQSLLDAHAKENGFFYAALFGRTIPVFSAIYDPEVLEPVTIGKGVTSKGGTEGFQIWATFRPRHAEPFVPPPNRFSNYRIETTIRPDLTLESIASFDYRADASDGRVLRFDLSQRLHVLDASIDGRAAEVFESAKGTDAQRQSAKLLLSSSGGAPDTGPVLRETFERASLASAAPRIGGSFLLISEAVIAPGNHHVTVRYSGGVIRKTPSGTYFVDARTSWFPYSASLVSTFDLLFHCPEDLKLVSTGELISEETQTGIRTVHRQAAAPRPFAGFNLGRYSEQVKKGSQYRIEVYSDRAAGTPTTDIPDRTERILSFYTELWDLAPLHSLAVSPIAGYFGQGFPGLVYLADAAYVPPENRAPALRTQRFDMFLDRLLLPHEIAHQWWGNLITSATYRSGWLVEALANDSALQYLAAGHDESDVNAILAQYRGELMATANGEELEATGPLDWGARLLNSKHPEAWHAIVYGKGTWVLHMLRQRLGDPVFAEFEKQMLSRFQQRPFTNDDVRAVAASLLPPGPERERDRDLQQFFDSWVYNTGLPRLQLRREGNQWVLAMTEVDDAFTVDVPIQCGRRRYLVRAAKGDTFLPRQTAQANSCALPSPHNFLYRN